MISQIFVNRPKVSCALFRETKTGRTGHRMPTSHQSPICGLFEFPGVLRLCGSSFCSQKKLIILRCIHHAQTYPVGDLVESLFVIVLSDVHYNLLITGSNIHQHSASTCIHQNHPKTIPKPSQNIPKPSKTIQK